MSDEGARALGVAESMIGVPYKWGGANPQTGFDCSGLVQYSYRAVGVSLPHNAAMQFAATQRIARPRVQPGDLLFFFDPIHHVALNIDGVNMVSADHPGSSVRIEPIAHQPRYIGAGRPHGVFPSGGGTLPPASGAQAAAISTLAAGGGIGDFLSSLTCGATWLRIAEVVGGGIGIALSLVFMVRALGDAAPEGLRKMASAIPLGRLANA